jgi:hypothetical protein
MYSQTLAKRTTIAAASPDGEKILNFFEANFIFFWHFQASGIPALLALFPMTIATTSSA